MPRGTRASGDHCAAGHRMWSLRCSGPCQVPLMPTQSLQELAEHQDYDLWAMDGIYLATSTIRGLESKPDSEQWEEPRQLL